MAIRSVSILKSWFVTGVKPLQSQFWDWLDSFRHRDEKIAFSDLTPSLQNDINSVSGFPITLNPGAASWTAPVDMVIEFIRVYDPATITFKMGTTVGGGEVWNGEEITAANRLLLQLIDVTAGTTYYFTGITASTVIKIFKR
ncbi:hypothetical protein ESA94_20490 [Lacibacter luteus]|uniref:Uncharacterized protein n=1 Tax=Lacibacter luteus TaxID=2508719 RepID=A0A4V1M700_9BACT|nr:hypothetical protein [Lacibacter luteus]RXK57580.1 hypothetical protein ESA94_20490 [Lacibacter luteus]